MVILDVLAGWPGSVHDSRILHNSFVFLEAIDRFPSDTHLLGDGGYPLSTNNGHLIADQRHFSYRLSSVQQTVERCNQLIKQWRKLRFLDHLSVELMLLLIISAFVLHNLCLINDGFGEGYFGDDDNNGSAHPLHRRAEQKMVHIMGMLN